MLVESAPNPSTDYLLRPRLASQGEPVVSTLDAGTRLQPGDAVVIVRYLEPAQRRAIESLQEQLACVVYFMDDDLLDRTAWQGLPADYRRRLETRACRHSDWLRRHCDEFWVSTEALARKYADWSPRVLALAPLPELLARHAPVRIAYHGTGSHLSEIRWLQPVLEQVLARCPTAHFEIFGDRTVNALYRTLPRTSVIHPMSWPNYLAFTAAAQREIGLAPLSPEPFNATRGAVKFFDFARTGAMGVYADAAPYRGFVRDGVDGLLLPMDPQRWIEALCALVDDAPRRTSMATAARARALADTSPAEPAS